MRAYRGRRVLVTGDTGFKGAWLTLWLGLLGAHVTGFALPPEEPSLFVDGQVERACDHVSGDVRDPDAISSALGLADPEVVFHLAAQAIVRRGYADPVGTFTTNVTGTLNLLEAIRRRGRPCAVVVVTSDKCYRPSSAPRSEEDPLGGDDPYSASKAACELVVAAYRASYFAPSRSGARVLLATARAGNVIGGGDWAEDRIVPDVVRALLQGAPVAVRNPAHIRPWQHVLEPLSGYLAVAAHLAQGDAHAAGAWNLGPDVDADRTVKEVVESFIARWGSGSWVAAGGDAERGETPYLRLDATKARERIGWTSRWSFAQTIERTVDWYRAHAAGTRGAELRDFTIRQIEDYAGMVVSS